LDAEVTRILDVHAPLRTGCRRSSGQHDTHVLSDEAQRAKQLRRRLERRCRRTGFQADKQAYDAACKAARDSQLACSASASKATALRRYKNVLLLLLLLIACV